MLSGTPALVANRPELSTTAQRFGGFVFDDLEAELKEILDKYEAHFTHFLHKRKRASSYILLALITKISRSLYALASSRPQRQILKTLSNF